MVTEQQLKQRGWTRVPRTYGPLKIFRKGKRILKWNPKTKKIVKEYENKIGGLEKPPISFSLGN